jgi:hypothetical protein
MQERAQNQSFSLPAGNNYAPQKPLIDLRDERDEKQIENHALNRQLKEKYDDLIKRDEQSWREMIGVGQIISNFIEGNQILEYNRFNHSYMPTSKGRNDPQKIKAINLLQYYVTNLLSKWGSSNPDILLTPYSNADQAIAQARKANAVVDYLENKWYSPFFTFQEGLSALTMGWYARQVAPDFGSKSFHALKEIVEEKRIPIGKGYGKCADCGKTSDTSKQVVLNEKAKPMDACPNCESVAYDYEPPAESLIKKVTGHEKVFLPDIICSHLHLTNTRFDIKRRAEESSWLIVEDEIEKGALRRMLGDLRIPEGESGNDFGLKAMEAISKAGSALAGSSGIADRQTQRSKFVLSKMYLSPDDMEEIIIGGDEQTVSKQKLPKGKKMSEAFPCGACIVGINGMSLIIGIFPDHHSQSVTSGVFHMKPMSGTGRGIGDAIEIQKQFNRRFSQIDRFFATRSTPATLHMEGAISPQDRKRLSQPDADIPVKMQNFPEVRDIRQLVAPLQGESVPGDLYNHTMNTLQGFMQITAHVTDFSGGLGQRVKNDTATGAEILDANADALAIPMLAIKADVTLHTAKHGFELFVNHTPVARFLPFKQKSQTNGVGLEISGEDVKGEYEWSIVPGSETPKNKFTKARARATFFAQFQGGVVGWLAAREQAPAEIAELERDFDVDFATDNYDAVGEVCRNRWEKAKQQLGKMDYMQIVAGLQPSLLITEPAHKEKVLWFANLLDTDEGQEMTNEERELVSTFILAHRDLAKGQAIAVGQDVTEVQMESQAPAQEKQQAMAAEQQQAQIAQQEAAQKQKMDEKNEGTLLKGVELLHKEAMQDKEHAQQRELAAMNQPQGEPTVIG